MRILITRPHHSGVTTAEKLRDLGHEVLMAPVITIDPTHEPAPNSDRLNPKAVILTSASACLDPQDLQHLLHLPCLTVGETTAIAAKEAGFQNCYFGDGAARSIPDLAIKYLPPQASLLIIAGEDRTAGLDEALLKAGFSINIWTRYRAIAANHLPLNVVELLKNDQLDVIFHFSKRSAAILFDLIKQAGLSPHARRLRHIAISTAVAEEIKKQPHIQGQNNIFIAKTPTQSEMLACLYTLSQE